MKKFLLFVLSTICLVGMMSCGSRPLSDEDIKGPYIEVNGEKINLRNDVDFSKFGADSAIIMDRIKQSLESVKNNKYE